MNKIIGIVAWFNKSKGYGEIVGTNGETYFFTYQNLNTKGMFKSAEKGQIFEFAINNNKKFGLRCASEMKSSSEKNLKKDYRNNSKEMSI